MSLFCTMHVCICNSEESTVTKWCNLPEYLRQRQRRIHIIKAVLKCLEADHGVIVDFKEAIQIITEQLLDHHDKYVEYHITVQHNDPRVTDSNFLISEAMDFFHYRQYTKDVVDLLVQVTADVLGIEIYIYQNHNGNIKQLQYKGGPITKPVHLKFTHNDINPPGNHYDAIIKDDIISIYEDEHGANLHMLSAVASKQPKVTAKWKSTVENKQIFKSPASSSTVSNSQTINTQNDIELISNEQIFTTNAEDIKTCQQSNIQLSYTQCKCLKYPSIWLMSSYRNSTEDDCR